MDQAASTLCTAGHALFFDCRSHDAGQLPWTCAAAGLELLVLDTRTPHALVDSEYATRRASCEQAARLLGVAALRDVDDLATALAQLEDEVMRRRVRHVVTENGRVLAAADLLRAGRSPSSARCWTPRTPRCVTTSRSPCPRWIWPWRRPGPAERWARE